MTKEERKERKRTLVQKFQSEIKKLDQVQLDQFADQAGITTIEGHPVSKKNAFLLCMQHPNPTVIGGYRQWQKAGHQVRKGETGLVIWVPKFNGNPDDDDEPADLTGFILGTVFDISQTDEIEATQGIAAD